MMQGLEVREQGSAKPLTRFEKAWRDSITSGDLRQKIDRLKMLRALALSEKIEIASQTISEWYEAFEGQVAVSYSGGKDSTVLLWLVRRLYPDVPAVFCNTGLEYPEILHQVKETQNIEIMRPKMPFHKIVQEIGWPVVSKRVAKGISILRHPTAHNQNIYGLYDRGVNRFGEKVDGFRVPARWRFLIGAPFPISDHCCQIMKKEPMHRYERQTKRVQFVGLLASDSKAREKVYLQHGCNAYDLKTPRSTPLGFWREQDILECLAVHQIPYASVYGQIVKDIHGKYHCTGVKSTGCVFCCFGLHMENSPENRFQKLAVSHPKLWRYCLDKLGLREVLAYLYQHAPDHLKHCFNPYPSRQMTLGFES